MKKALIIMIVAVMMLITGCKEVVSVEESPIDVKVESVRYCHAYTTFRHSSNGALHSTHHPARYNVTVSYGDISNTFASRTIYEYCKDKVGQYVPATLRTKTYDDGSIKRAIIWTE